MYFFSIQGSLEDIDYGVARALVLFLSKKDVHCEILLKEYERVAALAKTQYGCQTLFSYRYPFFVLPLPSYFPTNSLSDLPPPLVVGVELPMNIATISELITFLLLHS